MLEEKPLDTTAEKESKIALSDNPFPRGSRCNENSSFISEQTSWHSIESTPTHIVNR